jgi:hypothetical protein
MTESDVPTEETAEDYPDVREALRRGFERGREAEALIERMNDIREITFFPEYMSMKVMPGPLLARLESDESLRSDLELSLSAAFGRHMDLKVHEYQALGAE